MNIEVDLLTERGKVYIRITVEPYPYPISYKGEYHYRSGSTKQVLKGGVGNTYSQLKPKLH